MHDHALRLVDEEQRFFLAHDGAGELLLELGPLLERLRSDPIVRENLDAMLREVADVIARFEVTDAASVVRLKAIRDDLPKEIAEAQHRDGSARDTLGIKAFDRTIAGPSEVGEVRPREAREDTSKTKKAGLMLRVALGQDATKPDIDLELRAANIKEIEEEQAHTARQFSMSQRTQAGFSLERLHFVLRQINPRPEHQGNWTEYMDDRMRDVIGSPEDLLELVHGGSSAYDADRPRRANAIESSLRMEVQRVCRDLRRRIGATRSRLALVKAFAVRCSWYDATAMALLARSVAGKGKQKEDPLSDHLARFLFDNGLRPLTRATVGRLVPDVFDPSPPPGIAGSAPEPEVTLPAFYVEAKQYADKRGALKAILDGSRQIWSSADRIRKHYTLDEAFLVVFRRGGPLLIFPTEARSGTLVIRPVLVDVAGGEVSGSRAGEVIHITAEQLLAGMKPGKGSRPAKVAKKSAQTKTAGTPKSSPKRNGATRAKSRPKK